LWLEGAGVFERRGRAEALWIGAGPQGPLDALHRKIDQAAAAAGLGHETRAFRPHVTLARLPRDAGPPDEAMARIGRLGRLGLRASEVTLYESRLGAGDPLYVPLARYPLAMSDPARLRPPAPLA
jgi:2'-5' RNA ligase